MNVKEMNPDGAGRLVTYIAVTLILTVLTAWLVIAMQASSSFWPRGSSVWRRLAWPAFYLSGHVKGTLKEFDAIVHRRNRTRARYMAETRVSMPPA